MHIVGTLSLGSPPRMRGKLGEWEQRKPIYRITPAYAGKTISVSPFAPAATDHPRVCGENAITAEDNNIKMGSPPRMRGKRISHNIYRITIRITPAYAGKTIFFILYYLHQ